MLIEKFPELRALSLEEKSILTQELLDDLNAPVLTDEQEAGIIEVLNRRFEAYQAEPSTASSWGEVRKRLQEKTGASWQK